MAIVTYVMCTVLALACAYLLLRHYQRVRIPLLLWSGLCFVGLTLNNLLVLIDLVWLPDVNLFLVRNLLNLASVLVLLYGLVWEEK